jgi:excisionase family DNA binding protein
MTVEEIETVVAATMRRKHPSVLEDQCVSVPAAAKLLNLHPDTVHLLIRDDKLGHVGKGKLIRIRTSHIERYFAEHSDLKVSGRGIAAVD